MKRIVCNVAAVLSLLAASRCAASADRADELWTAQVEPLLDRYCFKCHGGVRQKSGLDLRSLANMLKGGERGPAIIPSQPENSHVYQFILKKADPHMPVDEKKQLKDAEIATIRDWIAALPGTNLVRVSSGDRALWGEAYVKAFDAAKQSVWDPPAGLSANAVIDGFIERGWVQRHAEPSPPADDRTFARRVYLDLSGRIPTPAELEKFVGDVRTDKRPALVDQLLASDDYARRMREVFDVVLLERRDEHAEDQRRDHGWFEFLEHAFHANYPWDRIVRELIVARPTEPLDRGAVWYLHERRNNHQAMAEAIAPIAFGVQIGCAQCHNHPLAAEIEQRHYWGLVAAFNRSKNVESATGSEIGESAIGGFINFTNLKKESQPVQLAFLNGVVVSEQRPGEGESEVDSPDKYLVPPPKESEKIAHAMVPRFSRREALADAATHDNPQLARAFVNRVWALLLGRGLVHPVDQLDSRHHPSHPDLLTWLARDFERSGYDIQQLVRNIVLSRTYQLDSRLSGEKAPAADAFARMQEKPLSAEQLYRSFLIATGRAETLNATTESLSNRELRRALIARFPEIFSTDANASLQQATFFSNSPLLDRLLQSEEGSTTARLLAEPSVEARVRLAFGTVLGREPGAQEMESCVDYLAKRGLEAGTKQLLWALLADAEFQTNH